MSNERLRAALVKANVTPQHLSEHLEVDPKTVERWITKDRVPHRRHRLVAAARLNADDAYLWPTTAADAQSHSASRAEFTEVYPARAAVPTTLWSELTTGATEAIDILTFAGSFLHDALEGLDQMLVDTARSGVRVRLLLGDPDSEAVRRRGEEEGIGDLLAARCRLSWSYFTPVLAEAGVEARAHGCTLYASLFRFDDRLLANPHIYGTAASHSPVHMITRIPGGRVFSTYMTSFERVWDHSSAYPSAA